MRSDAQELGLSLNGVADGALVFDVSGSILRVSPVPATRPLVAWLQ
jgi:hypothetical protein